MMLSVSERISSPILIGRSAELATIDGVLDATVSGGSTSVLISGEAGVGKTRLVMEISRRAEGRGMRVLRGGCANLGASGVPYDPFVEALRGLARDLDATQLASIVGDHGRDLARLVPALAAPGANDERTQVSWLQARLFEALIGLIQRLAADAPLVLVLEDLHWSDTASREAITFLLRSLRDEPVLLAMTFRSDELHRRHPLLPWLAEIGRTGRVERIELSRLSPDATRALVAAIAGDDPDEERLGRIYRRSDGNPFFIEELLAADRDSAGTDRLPTTLQDVLLARIAVVPDTARSVLDAAAVIGDRMDHELLDVVAGLEESDLIEALNALVANQLLVATTDTPTGDGYAFRHALVREAVHDDLLPGERRRLHRRAAEGIATRGVRSGESVAGYWAALAHHWSATGDDVKGFQASLRAGAAAQETFAFAAAAEQYERALEVWSDIPSAEQLAQIDRVALLGLAADAASRKGDYRREVALRREAIEGLDATVDPVRASVMQEQLARALWTLGETAPALRACEQAVAMMPTDPATPERARVLAGFGQMLMLLDRWEDSARLCEEAIDIADRTGALAAQGHAMNTLGIDLAALGNCTDGISSLEAARQIAIDTRNADDIGRAYVNLGDALHFCGFSDRAADVIDDGIKVAEAFGVTRSYGRPIRQGGALFNYELGRWDVATHLAMDSFLAGGTEAFDRYGIARWAPLLVGLGDPTAEAQLDRLNQLVANGPIEAQFSGFYHIARAEHELWKGRPQEALDQVEQGIRTLASQAFGWYATRLHRLGARAAADLAEVGRARRDPSLVERATRLGGEIRSGRARFFATGRAMPPGAALDEFLAEAATADAEDTRLAGVPSPDSWARSAERWAARQRPYLLAYARWREAEALLGSGARTKAAVPLAEAINIASALGARPLLEAAQSLASRARIRLGPVVEEADELAVPPDDPFNLTAREREVLALLALGRTNRQIGEALFISENTAGVHVSHILGKLGASGRAEAAAMAVRLGIAAAT